MSLMDSTDHADMTTNKPPRARVEDAIDTDPAPTSDSASAAPRSRDYLEGFLAAKVSDAPVGGEGSDLQADVIAALREIFDPEIPVNIYDLGLITGSRSMMSATRP